MLPFERIPSSCIIGIDPGVNGALAFLDTDRWQLGVIDMPTVEIVVSGEDRKEPSPQALAEIVKEVRPILVCSEKLQNFGFHPNPDDLMKMGRWRGQIEGIVAHAEVGFEHPYPAQWKRRMGLTSDKKFSRTRANALFPNCAHLWSRVKDHDRAEAAVIALYGCLALEIVPKKSITPIPLIVTPAV
jgi:crossover junction endodeoxyribonuclease RuvC